MTPRHAYSEENENQIISLIKKYPGLGLRELARELNISPQSLKYYTDALLVKKIILIIKDGKFSRFYEKDFKIEEFEHQILNTIRKGPLLNVIMVFLQAQKSSQKTHLKNNEIMNQLTILSAGTVSYYLNQLCESSIVVKEKEGYRLLKTDVIQHLINKYSPPKSIIDNFIDLWTDYFSI